MQRPMFGERLADATAARVGSWTFLIVQSALIAVWMFENFAGPWKPDPYPWLALNIILSLQAAYTGPVLLISANRQALLDRALLSDTQRLASEMHEEMLEVLTDLREILVEIRRYES